MSIPSYDSYKESGVEWLGEVPAHWNIRPFWTMFRRTKRTGYATEELLSVYRDFGVILKSSRDDNFNKPSDDLEAYQLVMPGDLAINKMKAWQGSVGISEHRGIVSPAYFIYEAMHKEVPRYLHYLLRSPQYINGYLSLSKGIRVNQWDLEPQYHSRMPVVFPSQEEQQTIVAFLDRETAKIDALISEQQRLIELLKEKRQSVISHAVTKGLNPNVPMKDSGIEWLGEVPANWKVPHFGRIISKAELGENHNSAEGNEGVPVMKMGNLDRGFVKLDKVEYLPEGIEVKESMVLEKDDFLFNTRNSLDLVGKVAIWRGELQKATFNSNILRIAFKSLEVATSAFMNYFFNSDLGLSQLRSLAKGTTSVAAIYYKDLTALRVVLPPPKDQHDIVSHLDNTCAQLDALNEESQHIIDLLQERRTALISAVVTGKIDVRGLVSANPEVEHAA
jgi:type I restriction enzyme S subunit